MNYKIRALREKLKSLNLEGMIVSNPINIKYLTNINPEIEGILLLESAIQQSLCSLAHKIMASTDKDPMNNKFFVND